MLVNTRRNRAQRRPPNNNLPSSISAERLMFFGSLTILILLEANQSNQEKTMTELTDFRFYSYFCNKIHH